MTGRAQQLPEVVLRPVRGHHAFEACVEQLATAIRLGVYPRGTTLPSERDLAERLSVSRATLREAMAALREAGLVETTRGRGGGTVVTLKPRTPSGRAAARITAAKRRDWLDALEFRRVVEPGAAAAGRAAPAQRRTAGNSWSWRTPRWRPPARLPPIDRPTRGCTSRSRRSASRHAWSRR